MSRRPTKHQQKTVDRSNEGVDCIPEFLACELPPGTSQQAFYLANALLKAGARYDRYNANRRECFDYAARRARFVRITKAANELASALCDLDILSCDELASRIEPQEVETFVGRLRFLSKETADLANEVQHNGRPRDLAEKRWIIELADIYENAFGRPASVWGSGDEPTKRRGKFYRLLEVSRPTSFVRHGKLSVRQINRTLKDRSRSNRALSPLAGNQVRNHAATRR